MKDIAEKTDVPPSVLSALYASVLPVFCREVERCGVDEAMEQALASVNNLSRKRLMEFAGKLHQHLEQTFQERHAFLPGVHPFVRFLAETTRASATKLGSLRGVYMSYSCSSSVKALKAEPFSLDTSADGATLLVGRKSIHGAVRQGIGIIQERQILYLLLNAFQEPGVALVSVYLRLPFLERVRYLRGLYIVPDYNQNPIARRIVLAKLDDACTPDQLPQVEARIIMKEEFTDEQRLIYDYVCGQADSIKMCTLPSPKLDLRDLGQEKKILEQDLALDD